MATSRAGRYPSWYRDDVVYVSAGDVYTSSRYGANTQLSPAQLAAMHSLDGAPNLRYEPNLGLFNVTASDLADRNWFRLRASTTHPVEQYWTLVCGDRRIEPQRGIAYVCLESTYQGVRYSAVDVAALHGMPTSHVSCFLARTMEEARNMTNGYRHACFLTRGNLGDEPNIVDISTGSELLPTVFHRGGIVGVDPASGSDQTSITRVQQSARNVTMSTRLGELTAENLRLALGGTRGVQGRMRLAPGMESQEVRPITAAQAIQASYFGTQTPARVSDASTINVNNAGMLSPEQADRFITSIMQSPAFNMRSPIAEAARAAGLASQDPDGWGSDRPPEGGSKACARIVKRGCIGIRASGIFHCSYRWGCDKCPVKLEEGKTVIDAGRLTRFVRRKKT